MESEATGLITSLGPAGLIALAVLVVTWVIKSATPLKRATEWLPIIAVTIGGGLGALLLPSEYAAKMVTMAVIQGMGLGLVAAGGKDLLTAALTIAKKMKNGGPTVLLIFILPALMMGGCTAHTAFRLEAITELGKTLQQMEVGAAEAQAGLLDRCAKREQQVKDAALEDLQGIATDADYDDAKKEIEVDAKMTKLWKIWGDIETDRMRGAARFRRMAEWTAHGRLLLARMMGLERKAQSVQEQLKEYEVLAEDYARRLFGLTPQPPQPVPSD